jgi:PIN domain nuclease of toxin-antitoxin system
VAEDLGASRLLLDTHVVLWTLEASPEMSDELRDRIIGEFEVFVSAASIWEISIKKASGKLKVPDDLLGSIERGGLSQLPIGYRHADLAGRLPAVHQDPFDRMLVAQAQIEKLTLVTRDRYILKYDVPTIMA